MRRVQWKVLIPGVMLVGCVAWGAATEEVEKAAPVRMASAANAFLDVLNDDQRGLATFAWEDDQRFDWHFIPRDRQGLSLAAMSDDGRRAAHALMRSTLSASGYLKATTIWRLEEVLYALESRPNRPASHRDPQRYWFSIFGTPGSEAWGFRLEGHHLSLNVSVVGDAVRCTPWFIGTNPAQVQSGPWAGLEVLEREAALGRALFAGLGQEQQQRALIAEEAPADVLLLPGRDDGFETAEGVPASDMGAASRATLRALLDEYLGHLRDDVANERRLEVDASFDQLHFAWAGSLAPGAGHYYRVTGDGFAIEYDNTQNGANHAHAVWREFTRDFGRDLLGDHVREHHPR